MLHIMKYATAPSVMPPLLSIFRIRMYVCILEFSLLPLKSTAYIDTTFISFLCVHFTYVQKYSITFHENIYTETSRRFFLFFQYSVVFICNVHRENE